MITVAGFNTSIDKLLRLPRLLPGEILRAHTARAMPGGKGLHVALTIATLGLPVRLVGLIDPGSRALFERFLAPRGVTFVGIEISEPVRTCLSIVDDEGTVTELREMGPHIDASVHAALCQAVLDQASALAVLSGSVAPGSPDTTYGALVQALSAKNVRTVVDASGALLTSALLAKPFAIKPNRDEASALLNTVIDTPAKAATATATLHARGIALPLLSLGALGLVAHTPAGPVHVTAPPVSVRNAVGSGDCLVGGVVAGLARNLPIVDALRLGVACATANLLTDDIGIIRREDVEALTPGVTAHLLS